MCASKIQNYIRHSNDFTLITYNLHCSKLYGASHLCPLGRGIVKSKRYRMGEDAGKVDDYSIHLKSDI